MRKIVILMLLCTCVSLSAQTVSSVSYNPSRSGTYSNLKVADRIMFLGGLEVKGDLDVVQNATFSWGADAKGVYTAKTLSGTGKLNFPQAVVSGSKLSNPSDLSSYMVNDSVQPTFSSGSADDTFKLEGGSATFGGDSYVGSIDSDVTLSYNDDDAKNRGKMRMYAKNVDLPTNSTVTIVGSKNAGTLAEKFIVEGGIEGGGTRFFYLAGGDIPYPAAIPNTKTLTWCSKSACTKEGDCASTTTVKVLCYR